MRLSYRDFVSAIRRLRSKDDLLKFRRRFSSGDSVIVVVGEISGARHDRLDDLLPELAVISAVERVRRWY